MKKKKPGRPVEYKQERANLHVRLIPKLANQLEAYCKKHMVSKQTAITVAIVEYLKQNGAK